MEEQWAAIVELTSGSGYVGNGNIQIVYSADTRLAELDETKDATWSWTGINTLTELTKKTETLLTKGEVATLMGQISNPNGQFKQESAQDRNKLINQYGVRVWNSRCASA